MPYINFHTHHVPDEPDVIAVVDGRDTWGIHPWHASEALIQPNLLDKLAIGECGLDAVCGVPMEVQLQVFIEQIKLSEQVARPLIIHCVRTLDQLLRLRRDLHPAMPWMFHGFRGKPQQLRSLLAAGFYVSFSFQHNEESLRICPTDRLLLETDDDGEHSIVELYNNVARKRGVEVTTLCQIMAENYRAFFRKEPLLT